VAGRAVRGGWNACLTWNGLRADQDALAARELRHHGSRRPFGGRAALLLRPGP
jgi:hypothetical protein